ncbi:NUDIX hydrolase [Ruficoccus amylovorans]|uniref:GDP-mannose pyrophosphatase n=1 Tax=Ruficoccus amylovorans TaxID=1804625 RepID=A0A842HIU6_9BACT|nr:NUDIX hydrolase [Ruficoccus amylovorans]MBC2596289.1 NUDIX hydrolase [Ruficoccus amylovorans]
MSERVPSLWVPGDENLHAQCKVYDVYKRHYRHPGDGRSGDFYIIHCNDWVQTVPLTEDGQVILVRQYRFGTQALSWEVPGGIIDDGEEPVAAGLRELVEETGYRCKTSRLLAQCYPNPALQENRTFFVLAEGCTLHSGQNLDQHEELEVKLFPVAEVSRMARNGKISHALAINSVFFLESYLAGQPVMTGQV